MAIDTGRITVRHAQVDDAASLCELIGQLGYTQSESDLLNCLDAYLSSQSVVLVAETEGHVIGFISLHAISLFHAPGSLARITTMCVSPAYRRLGVGRQLLQSIEEQAAKLGCSRIEVSSSDHRKDSAHVFYESQGYQLDCRRFLKHL